MDWAINISHTCQKSIVNNLTSQLLRTKTERMTYLPSIILNQIALVKMYECILSKKNCALNKFYYTPILLCSEVSFL